MIRRAMIAAACLGVTLIAVPANAHVSNDYCRSNGTTNVLATAGTTPDVAGALAAPTMPTIQKVRCDFPYGGNKARVQFWFADTTAEVKSLRAMVFGDPTVPYTSWLFCRSGSSAYSVMWRWHTSDLKVYDGEAQVYQGWALAHAATHGCRFTAARVVMTE